MSAGHDEMRRGWARAGALLKGVATPCYIPPSIMGNLPFITPDNCAKLTDAATRVVDYADIFSLAPLQTAPHSLRDALNLRDARVLLSARDYRAASNPPASKAGFPIATSTGKRLVTCSEFMQSAALLHADLVVPLADETPCASGNNRQRAAAQATLTWLDECIAIRADRKEMPLCGVIVGGADERLRRLCVEDTTQRDVQALLISGLDSCQDAAQRARVLETVVAAIAKTKAASLPRLVSGIGHPLDVLDAIQGGVDACISPFPAAATQRHEALIFWTRADEDDTRVRVNERERSGSVLHLREPRFARDFAPLLVDCDCYACQHYTRAYVHHLLNAREMLGDTLLYVHNLHHYERLFRTIREQIELPTWTTFVAQFRAAYKEHESTAPPLCVPLSIAERKAAKDAEQQQQAAGKDKAKRQDKTKTKAKDLDKAKAED